AMLNHIASMRHDLALTYRDVIAQTAYQSYVVSVWQFLAALTVGAALRIVPEETLLDPAALVTTFDAHSITVVELVPSQLRLIVEELEWRQARGQALLPSLRRMASTGEALPPALVRRWFNLCPQIPLLNAYGSSECADDSAHDQILQPPAEAVTVLPIGQPLPNMQTYVLDQYGQPSPIGVAGELYVGGVGVGRGYLHDPERTAQVFLTNHFHPEGTARLYKSGDRVRRVRNGNIEYLGRLDFQVKVRGIRVELGEIEAILGKHPAVTQVVVMAVSDRAGHQQLIAYVVPTADAAITATALRHFVGEHLPDYMVPSVIMLLDHLPLNTSGKVARRLLPEPTQLVEIDSAPYVAPRNEIEETLVDILSTVLGIEAQTLGVHHNFFDLGGHSMQAIQIVWQLRDRLGVELPLRSIFEQTTVEQLANLVIDAQLARIDAEMLDALLTQVEQTTATETQAAVGMVTK
ncbi:MAG: non-ribosomal peptide synthetase, partial [Caldilineaceae bacterium]|nr:non-ribosomal peptide synthetase [Caldilineaceae bacterium]